VNSDSANPFTSPLEGEVGSRSDPGGGYVRHAHRLMPALQRARAKRLRGDLTYAERSLWYQLRAHRFHGFAFRRQALIGRYIVDFVCHDARVIVELDGGQHASSADQDAKRDRWLAGAGYRVLRFWNSDVLRNRDEVLAIILRALRLSVPPSLTLPLKGGGDQVATAQQNGYAPAPLASRGEG
jgi:very-short-patch-repair endonuclease